jgi:hypothetical protein
MLQGLIVFVLLALAVACGEASTAAPWQFKTETQQSIATLYGRLKQLDQPTPREKELMAACSRNCSAPELQREMDSR